jgi:hypothetical protein
MSNEFDDVSLGAAHTTIEDLFADIDGEAVVAATHRTWTELLRTDTFQCDATPSDFVFEPYGAGTFNVGSRDHEAPRSLSATATSQSSCFCVG